MQHPYFCTMKYKVLWLTLFYFNSLFLAAQSANIPTNYFQNPLDISMDLSSNFGELRSGHWHMGLDIRTHARPNYTVHAAAQGYIAHIGIRPGSFGQFIIINHPNGLSTLYAHLNSFFPELQAYITKQQYAKKSWAIELDFQPQQFPVPKGFIIAQSGNTGGSLGPHLHFEIFNTKSGKRLNPLLFNFPIKDDLNPQILKLAMYDRNLSVYEQAPVFYNVKNSSQGFILANESIMKVGSNRISFAIRAFDKMNSRASRNGIYMAKLFFDNREQIRFVLDSIDYDETVYINAQIDYQHKYNGGSYLQHLSKLPGDKGPVYKEKESNGVLYFNDTLEHTVHIEVYDAYGNVSQLKFMVQYDSSLAGQYNSASGHEWAPNKSNVLLKKGFEFFLSPQALYDTVEEVFDTKAEATPYTFSSAFTVGNDAWPIHDDALVRIQLNKQVPAQWQDKLFIVRTTKKGTTEEKAVWEKNWLSAKFGSFGKFQIQADVQPPGINNLGKGDTVNLTKARRIVFKPTDNFGIQKFDVFLDGNWLMFTNDKYKYWIYDFDERCAPGVHELRARAEDKAGNVTEKTWWFRR